MSKGYGDRLLIEDLTFSLPPAGIVGVIGANGAGKTTLFRMITGVEAPDGGELRSVRRCSSRTSTSRGDALDPDRTVYEEITEGASTSRSATARSTAGPMSRRSTSRAPTSRRRSACSPAASATASTWRRC